MMYKNNYFVQPKYIKWRPKMKKLLIALTLVFALSGGTRNPTNNTDNNNNNKPNTNETTPNDTNPGTSNPNGSMPNAGNNTS